MMENTLLEVFRELEIRGSDGSRLAVFVDELSKSLPAGWTRDRARERELSRLSASEPPQFAFGVASHGLRPAARVFLMQRADALKITNIVPEALGQLSRGQYNGLVEAFQKLCEPIAQRIGLKVNVTSDQQDIAELLTPKAMKALQLFSSNANRNILHPLDRERWLKFLIYAHEEETSLDAETLGRWLTEEQRWSEDQAAGVLSEYAFARDLLHEYHKSKRR